MFQLTKEESELLRCQFGTLKNEEIEVVPIWNHLENLKYRSSLPYVFTEHGVLMSANVLNSEKANIISVEIIKVFVKLRHYALSQNGTNEQILELRQLLMLHVKNSDYKFSEHDVAIEEIICALNNLIEKPKKTRKIGFHVSD